MDSTQEATKNTEATTENIIQVEAKILEQEHRLISCIINFLNRHKWEKTDPRRKATISALLWLLLPGAKPATVGLSIVGLVTLILAYEANIKLENQNTLITVQNALSEAQRRSSLNIELSEIMNEINKDLTDKTGIKNDIQKPIYLKRGHKIGIHELSEVTKSRIIAISQSLKPYRALIDSFRGLSTSSVSELRNISNFTPSLFFSKTYDVKDFLDTAYLSPERGQLLLALTKLRIIFDGTAEIGQLSNFNYSDLRNANLRKSDIRSAKLDFSNFDNSNIEYTIFDDASMESTSFISTQGTHTRFVSADLVRANFTNATLHSPDFKEAYLLDATFDNASLISANFENVSLEGVSFQGANLEGANFDNVLSFKSIRAISGALVNNIQNAPDGFIQWAIDNGATTDSESYVELQKSKNPERYYRVSKYNKN